MISTSALTLLCLPILWCVFPPALSAGLTSLSVSWGNGIRTKAVNVTVCEPPRALEAVPSRGASSGGSVVTVLGERFAAPMTCAFGTDGTPVEARVVSSTELECMTSKHDVGTVSVQVSRNGVECPRSEVQFVFSASATIVAVTPSHVRVDASEVVVTVTGEHFGADTWCQIGQRECSSELVSTTRLLCRTSGLGVGNHSVKVYSEAAESSGASVTVLDPMELTSVGPSRAHVRGGTRLTVYGKNLVAGDEAVQCKIGSTPLSVGEVLDGGRVECVSPRVEAAGTVELALVSGGMQSNSVSVRLLAQDQAELMTVQPGQCSVDGCNVQFTGEAFSDEHDTCRFGSRTSAATVLSSSMVQCAAPSAGSPGTVRVEVTSASGELGSTELAFTYGPSARVEKVVPSRAQSSGTVVQVIGDSFIPSAELACRFGEERVSATWESSTVVRCQVPSMPLGEVSVGVSNHAADFNGVTSSLEVTSCCDVYMIRPSRGSVQGGSQVTVSGSGMSLSDRLVCVFGGVRAAAVVVSISAVTCESPATDVRGIVGVQVTDDSATLGTGAAASFEYMERAVVTKVTPSAGPMGGARVVTLTGRGFAVTGQAQCKAQDATSECLAMSSTSMRCMTPSVSAAGLSALEVSFNGQEYSMSGATYRYTKDIAVTGLIPSRGSEQGGTVVTVVGSGFDESDGLRCYFGGDAILAQWLGPDRLLCVASKHLPGNISVAVGVHGPESVAPILFGFFATPIIELVFPSSGSIEGGTTVTIEGANFDSTASLACLFGNIPVAAHIVDHLRLLCKVPPTTVPGNVDLALSMGASPLRLSSSIAFAYAMPSAVVSADPYSGPATGGTHVKVTGSFPGGPYECLFGDIRVSPSLAMSDRLVCISPEHPVRPVPFVVLHQNVSVPAPHRLEFFFHSTIRVLGVRPSEGYTTGGTRVTVFGGVFAAQAEQFCAFGNSETQAAMVLSSTALLCLSPPHEPATATVKVSRNGLDFSHEASAFRFVPVPVISSVSPSVAMSDSPASLILRVDNLLASSGDAPWCDFGDVRAPVLNLNASALSCWLPARSAGPVELHLRGTALPLGLAVSMRVADRPVVDSEPLNVFAGEAARVAVTGRNFAAGARCRVTQAGAAHDDDSPAEVLSSSLLRCMLPPLAAGPATVDVSAAGDEGWSLAGAAVRAWRPPRVARAAPSLLPAAGGVAVTLIGGVFARPGALRVLFGEARAALLEWRSAEEVLVLAPPRAGGAGNSTVLLSVDGESFADAGARVQYVAGPPADGAAANGTAGGPARAGSGAAVERVAPAVTGVAGGAVVSIFGRNFAAGAGAHCRFGEVPAPAEVVSSSLVRCVAPPLAAPAELSLEVSFAASLGSKGSEGPTPARATASGVALLAAAQPAVGALAPARVYAHTPLVTLRGRGFLPRAALRCLFGRNASAPLVYVSRELATCALPALRPGRWAVAVVFEGQSAADAGGPPAVLDVRRGVATALRPSSAPARGGHALTVLGSGFEPEGEALWCVVGGADAPATVISEDAAVCAAPPGAAGAVGVHLRNAAGARLTPAPLAFEYGADARAALLRVSPSTGPPQGGVLLLVDTAGLAPGAHGLLCELGGAAAPAEWRSATQLACRLPPGPAGASLLRLSAAGAPAADGALLFAYHPPAAPRAASPALLAAGRPAAVTVTGESFLAGPGLLCLVGAGTEAPARLLSPTAVECALPALRAGNASLAVANDGGSFAAVPAPLRVLDAFEEGVRPSAAPARGGARVTVTGAALGARAAVFFGHARAACAPRAPGSLLCTVPPRAAGLARVWAFAEDGDTEAALAVDFAYLDGSREAAELRAVRPSTASAAGGALVTLQGRGFDRVRPPLLCRIGAAASEATLLSASLATCVAPPGAVGAATVAVGSGASGFSPDELPFEYAPDARVDSVHPTAGPASGGGLVTVVGSGFSPSPRAACRFGAAEAARNAWVSSSLVVCAQPPHAAGVVNVLVSNEGGRFGPGAPFLFESLAAVTRLDPPFGAVSGGTHVRLEALPRALGAARACEFGAARAELAALDGSVAVCVSPPAADGAPGPIGVRVLGAAGLPLTALAHFTYIARARAAAVGPTRGPLGGRQALTVRGAGFADTGAARCRLGTAQAPARVLSSSELVCLTPPAAAEGQVSVDVSLNGVDFTDAALGYWYAAPPVITALQPSRGGAAGGTAVTVIGRGIDAARGLRCFFGPASGGTPAEPLGEGRLRCIAPPHAAGNVSVALGELGPEAFAPAPYAYASPPDVRAVAPSSGNVAGGALVTLFGANFDPSGANACVFGAAATAARVLDRTRALCRVPGADAPGEVALVMRVDSGDAGATGQGVRFTFTARAPGVQIEPSLGPTSGGTVLSVRGARFAVGARCVLAGRVAPPAPATLVSSTLLLCATPPVPAPPPRTKWTRRVPRPVLIGYAASLSQVPSPAGLQVDVELPPPGARLAGGADALFSYHWPVEVSSVEPPVAAPGGALRVVGAHFEPAAALACVFGRGGPGGAQQQHRPALFRSSTLVLCVAPGHAAGAVAVHVTNNGADLGSSAATFRFAEGGVLAALAPSRVPAHGGVLLSLQGSGFTPGEFSVSVGPPPPPPPTVAPTRVPTVHSLPPP